MDIQALSQANIDASLKEITAKAQTLSIKDADSRRELLDAAQALCRELETPMESIYRLIIIQPLLYMSVRIAINAGLFEVMAREDSKPRSAWHLAEIINADPVLLGRLLKNMAASQFIKEVASDEYELTPVSASLLNQSHKDGFPFCHDILLPSFSATVQYLAETQYKNPQDLKNSPFQLGHNTKLSFFEYLGTHPKQAQQFNNFMGLYAQGRPRWLDPGHYPIRERLVEGADTDPNSVFMVDVGGGKGHDITLFQKLYKDIIPGRLVLQDMPTVIQQAGELPAGIEGTPHDFFKPNPVVGARTYYFHSVLHGWPDAKALEILKAVAASMKRGYSRLLINEIVIPDEDANKLSTSMDLLMMTVVAAEERTEKSWARLLPLAGLKLVKTWKFEIGTESVIEAELADDSSN